MKYPKYKLAFPGKHVIVFKGHPMTQFGGYTLGTYASGNGIVSANKTKGFWGESAELFQSAADYYTFAGYSANKGTVNGNTYIFGKGDDIVTAFFNDTVIYNLFLNQTQGGTITGIPMSGHSGQYIVLSALPSSHYTFNGYSVTGGVLSGDKIIIGNSDMTAKAYWIEDPKYTLTIQQTNGGKVTANKSTGYKGDQVTLSNTPSSHYTFGSYDITGATLTGDKFNFVNQNVTAKGVFIEDPKRTVTLAQQTGGTITANPMTGYDGTVVVLSNTANPGYTFNSYSITGGTLTGSRFTLTGNNVTVKPNYTHNVYSVTLQQNNSGTITASPMTGYYGTNVTLSNTANAGYTFGSYSLTGATLTGNKFNFGTQNVTAKGNFYAAEALSADFYMSGYITPTQQNSRQTSSISFSNSSEIKPFTFANFGLFVVTKQINVPNSWIKTYNGSSYYNPSEEIQYSSYSARMIASSYAGILTSPKNTYFDRDITNYPYFNSFNVDDSYDAYKKTYGSTAAIYSHAVGTTPEYSNYEWGYGGHMRGNTWYDNNYQCVTYNGRMPGLLTWITRMSGCLSSTASKVDINYDIVDNGTWWMSGRYVSTNYNPLNLPDYTIRLKYTNGVTPTFSKGTGVQVSQSPNVWDLTYNNSNWYQLLYGQSNLIEILGANTNKVTNMKWAFRNNRSLSSVAIFDTSNVTDMNAMFDYCTSLTSIPLFPTTKSHDMYNAFYNCSAVKSGALALYRQASTQTTPPSSHYGCFYRCGIGTRTGSAELAQIQSDWK